MGSFLEREDGSQEVGQVIGLQVQKSLIKFYKRCVRNIFYIIFVNKVSLWVNYYYNIISDFVEMKIKIINVMRNI